MNNRAPPAVNSETSQRVCWVLAAGDPLLAPQPHDVGQCKASRREPTADSTLRASTRQGEGLLLCRSLTGSGPQSCPGHRVCSPGDPEPSVEPKAQEVQPKAQELGAAAAQGVRSPGLDERAPPTFSPAGFRLESPSAFSRLHQLSPCLRPQGTQRSPVSQVVPLLSAVLAAGVRL